MFRAAYIPDTLSQSVEIDAGWRMDSIYPGTFSFGCSHYQSILVGDIPAMEYNGRTERIGQYLRLTIERAHAALRSGFCRYGTLQGVRLSSTCS